MNAFKKRYVHFNRNFQKRIIVHRTYAEHSDSRVTVSRRLFHVACWGAHFKNFGWHEVVELCGHPLYIYSYLLYLTWKGNDLERDYNCFVCKFQHRRYNEKASRHQALSWSKTLHFLWGGRPSYAPSDWTVIDNLPKAWRHSKRCHLLAQESCLRWTSHSLLKARERKFATLHGVYFSERNLVGQDNMTHLYDFIH